MNLSEAKSSYETDGFVVLRDFLPPEEFRELRANVDRYIREVVPGLPDSDAFYEDKSRPETLKQMNRMHNDPYFAAYLHNERWISVAEALLGEPAVAQGAEWFNKPPNTEHITPPHQDNYYFCWSPPQVLTMWLALETVDEENGCLRYVRGSHLLAVRPHNRTATLGFSQGITDYGDADRAREVPISARPGDLLVHHGNMIHRADANRSTTRHRPSFGMVIKGQSCRRDDAAFERYSQSSKAQQQEMGVKM